uniref:Uncharacterized protein n=1 Tax=Timema tahoe TaxID=61484 RepID=A0A7R9IPG3_9NEOP|nr:unnamed protein product [Timema tahoe]
MRTITRKVEDYQKQKGKARRNGLGVVVREGLREEVKELRLKKVNIGLKDKTVMVMQVYATQVGRRSNWEDRDEHSWASSMAVSGQNEQDVRRCYQQMDGEGTKGRTQYRRGRMRKIPGSIGGSRLKGEWENQRQDLHGLGKDMFGDWELLDLQHGEHEEPPQLHRRRSVNANTSASNTR